MQDLSNFAVNFFKFRFIKTMVEEMEFSFANV